MSEKYYAKLLISGKLDNGSTVSFKPKQEISEAFIAKLKTTDTFNRYLEKGLIYTKAVEPSKADDKVEPSKADDKGEPSKADDKGEPSKADDKGEPSKADNKGEPSKADDKGETKKGNGKNKKSNDTQTETTDETKAENVEEANAGQNELV